MSSTIKFFLNFIVLTLPSFIFTAASPTNEEIDMKNELLQLINDHRVRAAVVISIDESDSIGIMKLGEISDSRREPPNENTTVFEIGSITKVFTALLVQTLVDDELLHWDKTISECLPDIEFANEAVANVTLRELATHRSGLPRLPNNFAETEVPAPAMDPYATYGEQNLVSFFESFDPTELKNEYGYSNLGFALLGYVAAKTLEVSYAEAMYQRVFKPLKMNNSSAFDSIDDDTELAAGYSYTANMGVWNFNIHAGAGVIRSTAQDLYKFILANFREVDDAIHRAIRSIRELQYESGHALGWITETSRNDTTVYVHNGQTGGYASFLALDPTAKRGWVILAASTESDAIAKLGTTLYRDIEPSELIDLTPYSGVYSLGANRYMTMSESYGRLQMQVTGQPPLVLEHVKDHQFKLEALNYSATFEIGEEGVATTLMWSQPGGSIDAKRVDDSYGIATREEVSIDSELLTDYVGEYQLPLNQVATVKRVKDRLFVHVTGQAEVRVFPLSPTRFFFKVADAEIEFEKDEDGKVKGVVFHQAGAFRAPRIDEESD